MVALRRLLILEHKDHVMIRADLLGPTVLHLALNRAIHEKMRITTPLKAFVLNKKFDLGVDALLHLSAYGLSHRTLLSKFLANSLLDFSFKTIATRPRLPDRSLLLAGTQQCDRFGSFPTVFEILISKLIGIRPMKPLLSRDE